MMNRESFWPSAVQSWFNLRFSPAHHRQVLMADKITRIAIVDANRCKPKRCAQECKKVCRDETDSRYLSSSDNRRASHVLWSRWVSVLSVLITPIYQHDHNSR